ncbi:MAG: indole-3-glycerol phosphate synthase TrpC [Methanobacteriota archaeon]
MSVLDKIVRDVRVDVQHRAKIKPIDPASIDTFERRSLFEAIRRSPDVPLITEIKRASPSAGDIRPKLNHVDAAMAMLRGGAISLSVLTEPRYFKGDSAFLQDIRKVAKVPLLYKNFVLDDYQVYEAAQTGADVVLLIVKVLGRELQNFMKLVEKFGMESLVEVTNEEELKHALAVGANLLGVNNRDLNTLAIDLNCTVRLAPMVPDGALLVSESGISSPGDVRKMLDAGADAMLVGTAIMRDNDIEGKVRTLVKAR